MWATCWELIEVDITRFILSRGRDCSRWNACKRIKIPVNQQKPIKISDIGNINKNIYVIQVCFQNILWIKARKNGSKGTENMFK